VQDIFTGLNDAQLAAVNSLNGASLIIAGAGSGKTRVLTCRVANLLNKGVESKNLMSLTFTNKAAREMKDRIAAVVGDEAMKEIWMGTFHSLFSKILRFEAAKLGFTGNYTIYDTQDCKSTIKKIVKDLHLDGEKYKPNDVLSSISMAKNNLITPQTYANNPALMDRDKAANMSELGNIYRIYSNRLRKADAMDFDDLLLYTNILFRDHKDVLEKYQKRFKYIMVDEYQDTNFAQYLIIKKLATNHGNISVVGDDAQSIYSFRGAKVENILNFKNDYPGCNVFKLEQNYRSTQTIVNAANSVIAKNKSQIQKNTFSENKLGDRIKVIKCSTDSEEGHIVSDMIQRLTREGGLHYSDFAILYRTNSQSRIFEEALHKRNIPCKIHGGLSFFQRKEIKDVLAYLRLAVNHRDEEALLRVINYPTRGIGDATMEKLEQLAEENAISMWMVIEQIESCDGLISPSIIGKIVRFRELIKDVAQRMGDETAFEVVDKLCNDSGILKDLSKDQDQEGVARYENVQELINAVKDFTETEQNNKLNDFLEKVALLTDTEDENAIRVNKVTLMTVHSSKGLEFKHCFIVGMEETLFPSAKSSGTEEGLEEERRLFYVAITRAETHCYLSYAFSRRKFGNLQNNAPSRFLGEIDLEYLDLPLSDAPEPAPRFEGFVKPEHAKYSTKNISGGIKKALNRQKKQKKPVKIKGDNPAKFKEGMVLFHEKFGAGQVVEIQGVMPEAKAVIDFESCGKKNLLLKYAKLKIVEDK